MNQKPGNITVPTSAVYDLIPDADAKALEWIEDWADKVPEGTGMILAKMKCTLAEEPCGCPEDSFLYTCMGPNPPVPIEIVMKCLMPEDGSKCSVPGVEGVMLPAPQVVVSGSWVQVLHFMGPGEVMYIKKVSDGCHGCEGTCCTGVGSEPCTC
jgi:hypothetical protein